MAIVSLILLVVIILLPQGVLRARPRKSKTRVDEALRERIAAGHAPAGRLRRRAA